MLNKESRSYFQRAYAASGSLFQSYVFSKANHTKIVQKCSNITETDKLMEYLKTENSSALIKCPRLEGPMVEFNIEWVPVIESNATKSAFLTKTPEEIFNGPTEELPIMDTLFSFTGEVLNFRNIHLISK